VALKKWDPMRDILFLQERMSRMFNEALRMYEGADGLAGPAWSPPVDIYETVDKIVLKAELPGMEIDDVCIEVKGNSLVLKGERRMCKQLKEENYHRMERYYGTFSRTFCLPNQVDRGAVSASLRDGVLEITVPKARAGKAAGVKVRVE